MTRATAAATKPAETAPEPAETPDATEAALAVFAGDIEAVDGVYTGPDGQPLGLYARLAKIKDSLPDVDPEGTNEHFKYKFIKNTQVLGLLRPRLARQRIMVIPETVEEREPIPLKTKRGGDSLMTRITVTWRVVDGVSGESFTGQSVGYGDDSGDKGANKAFTAAQKNYLLRLFEIGGDRDIEEDEETDRRAKTRDAGSERVSRVEIGDADIEGVKRGGRSEKATDAQVARVGQYIRDLELTPDAFVQFVDRVLGDQLELGDDPWVDIKHYLEGLDGPDIGKLVARFDEILNSAEDRTRGDDGGSGYE